MPPAPAPANAYSVSLEPGPGRWPLLSVCLKGALSLGILEGLEREVLAQAAALGGRPFGLMFDLTEVTALPPEGAQRLHRLELSLGGQGVEAVAHKVANPELAQAANEALRDTEASNLIRTFTDNAAARSFASGQS